MKALNLLLAALLLLFYPNKFYSQKKESKSVMIAAVGDVMLGNHLNKILKEKSYGWPFLKTVSYFREADIAFCNLEAPLTKSQEKIEKYFNFKAEPEAVKSLVYAGIDIVSLANNHSMDYGVKGLEETIAQLERHGINYVGVWNGKVREPLVIEKNGLKVAFLAYSGVSPAGFESKNGKLGIIPSLLPYIMQDVKKATTLADIVIVSFHFGEELSKEPNDYQKTRARAAIDAGADLVIGHHPHVLQPIERYKGKLIAYSLGNFVFGCYNQIKESAILQVEMSKEGIENIEIIPVDVDNYKLKFQPKPFEGSKKDSIIGFMLSE